MYGRRKSRIKKFVREWGVFMSAILKQKLIDIANGFTKYGLWKGGGSSGSSALSDMTDVSFSNLKENNILKYNGSAWVNDDNLHEYSTEEKIVGKWIDARNIYERVINVENIVLQSYSWTNIFMIENMEMIIYIECIRGTELNDGRLRWNCLNNYVCGAAEENNFTISSATIILKYIKTE